jgi:hypothetical protein
LSPRGRKEDRWRDPSRGRGRRARADRAEARGRTHARHHGGHHAGHGHGAHHGHGHGDAATAPPPRIRSALALASAGGLDTHPLFATALLDRARALSRDPRKDTVILVAHGTHDDGRNQQWLDVLRSIAAQMKAEAAGAPFRNVRGATWREDWPDKRAPWIERVRAMVDEAGRDGGRAIVIPARTNGTGPERRFLEGQRFETRRRLRAAPAVRTLGRGTGEGRDGGARRGPHRLSGRHRQREREPAADREQRQRHEVDLARAPPHLQAGRPEVRVGRAWRGAGSPLQPPGQRQQHAGGAEHGRLVLRQPDDLRQRRHER